MKQATQVYSPAFDEAFFSLPPKIQAQIEAKIQELGRQLESFSHHRLQGRREYRMLDWLDRPIERRIMAKSRQLTAIIEPEGDGYVALCPELDIASQGSGIEEARVDAYRLRRWAVARPAPTG